MTFDVGTALQQVGTESHRRPLFIKKFGGTSVSTIERMQRIAQMAIASQRAGNQVVLVVSAMGGETDRLLSLARKVLSLPTGRELDVLVSTGEQASAALVAMAIHANGGEACSFLGHQLPLHTDDAFTKARILHVEADRIRVALSRGQIPVVAGFQGMDGSKNVTTLGRGGSDTTAVALAAALEADVCEIYTDVEGVYSADPRLVSPSRKLPFISYEEMLELASLGAKVLQVRSVEIAMKYGVVVHVRSSFSNEEGTWVGGQGSGLEAKSLAGLACARSQARVELVNAPWRQDLVAEVTSMLADQNVCADMLCITRLTPESRSTSIAFTLAEADLIPLREPLDQLLARWTGGELRVTERLAKVSLVGIGVRSEPEIAARLCRSLLRRGIEVLGLAVGELRISCLVQETAADDAIRVVHDAFGLSQDQS